MVHIEKSNGNGNGAKLLQRIPWVPVVAVIGWVATAVAFYQTTNTLLSQHQKDLEANTKRIELVYSELVTLRQRIDRGETPVARRVDAHEQLLGQLNDRLTAQASRFETVNDRIKAMENRQDRIVQAFDSFYNQFTEFLRTQKR